MSRPDGREEGRAPSAMPAILRAMRRRANPRLILILGFGAVWAVALAFVIATGSGADLGRAREAERAARPQTVVDAPAPRPIDEPDAYRPLPKPRPTVVESEAGVPGAVQNDEQAPAEETRESEDPARPPSDEEIRAELAQLKDYYASLPAQLSPTAEAGRYELTAGELDGLTGWQSSVASVYFDYGGPLACGGRLRRDQFGVANKNLPCGTMVTFRYGGKALRVPVIDRGPYIKGREWDLTGATAIALRFPGLGPIEWTLG